jgi:hypothetical protein
VQVVIKKKSDSVRELEKKQNPALGVVKSHMRIKGIKRKRKKNTNHYGLKTNNGFKIFK